MSSKETVVLETVLSDLNRPNQEGDQIVPVQPLAAGEDEVYNSLYATLKAGVEISKINKTE